MPTLLRTLTFIALGLFAGCATHHEPPVVQLDPALTAAIFDHESRAAAMIDNAKRQWLIGAAYFVAENGRRLETNDELFDFLEAKLQQTIELRDSVRVAKTESGAFVLPLRSGKTANVAITDSRLVFRSADPVFIDALIRETMQRAAPRPQPSSDKNSFGWTTALVHIFRK